MVGCFRSSSHAATYVYSYYYWCPPLSPGCCPASSAEPTVTTLAPSAPTAAPRVSPSLSRSHERSDSPFVAAAAAPMCATPPLPLLVLLLGPAAAASAPFAASPCSSRMRCCGLRDTPSPLRACGDVDKWVGSDKQSKLSSRMPSDATHHTQGPAADRPQAVWHGKARRRALWWRDAPPAPEGRTSCRARGRASRATRNGYRRGTHA